MAIYDNNWKSYAMYVTSTVESGANYGAVESYAMVGIGIMQWSHSRSWILLNLMVTDYPETDWQSIMPNVYPQVNGGSTQWDRKVFTQQEANEISVALVTDEGVATQNKLWNRDCDESYIPLLRDECGLTDPKTAIYALTNYHQSPQAFYQIYNGAGNADLYTWNIAVRNNGIVGSYSYRQDTVMSLLEEWDGESGKEGFGSKDSQETIGGNQDPNYGNPDNTYTTTSTEFSVGKIFRQGKELILTLNVEDKDIRDMFIRINNQNLYLPTISKFSSEKETETKPTPITPEFTGSNEDLEWIINKMRELNGTLQYSKAMELRTNIEGGYCDCSGLVWWLYNQRGYNIGTWTGTQIYDGELIKESRGQRGTPCSPDGLQVGDLVLFSWEDDLFQYYGHIELYMGGDVISGHGGDPYYGPVEKSLSAQTSYAYSWMVRRVIKVEPSGGGGGTIGGGKMNGVDISNHQAGLNVSGLDAEFVIMKASEGTHFQDAYMGGFYAQAVDSGKLCGFYHFASGNSSGTAEADYFIDTLGNKVGSGILVLDWEADALGAGEAYAKEFLDRVKERTGKTAFLYTSLNEVNNRDWSAIANTYPLWIAAYPNGYTPMRYTPDIELIGYRGQWDRSTMLGIYQYSSTGVVDGSGGRNLDINVAYMTAEQWKGWQ